MKRNIGVIGTGDIAYLHMEAVAPLGWQIIGAYDINPSALQAFCVKNNCRPYKNADAILKDAQIDTVYVCTQHDSHVKLGCAAILAGKNVFMEKPPALTVSGAQELLKTHSTRPVPFVVGYNMRVAPATVRFCELLKMHGAQIEAFRASMTGPSFMEGWASDSIRGGGVLVCQGSHMFDLLEYVLGSPVVAVCAVTQHLSLDISREPNASMLLIRLKNDVFGTLLLHDRGCSSFHAGSEGRMANVVVYSPQGTFEMDVYGKVRWGTTEGFFEESPCMDCSQILSWGYAAEAKEFGKFIDSGETRLCTLEESIPTVEAIAAARISAQTMKWTLVKNE